MNEEGRERKGGRDVGREGARGWRMRVENEGVEGGLRTRVENKGLE